MTALSLISTGAFLSDIPTFSNLRSGPILQDLENSPSHHLPCQRENVFQRKTKIEPDLRLAFSSFNAGQVDRNALIRVSSFGCRP